MTDAPAPLTREEAMRRFRILVGQYGLQWTVQVPAIAYEQLREINKVLTTRDRREALGFRVR